MSGRCSSDEAFQPCVFKAQLKRSKLKARKFETGRKKNNLWTVFLKCGS